MTAAGVNFCVAGGRSKNNGTPRTTFAQKALHAQAAGAVAVIVANSEDQPLRPAGDPNQLGGEQGEVVIPVLAVPRNVARQLIMGTTLVSIVGDLDDSPPPASELDGPVGGGGGRVQTVLRDPGDELRGGTKYFQMGSAAQSAGEASRAVNFYGRALALNPRHAAALQALGSVPLTGALPPFVFEHARCHWLLGFGASGSVVIPHLL
jgi:hypothetical protein